MLKRVSSFKWPVAILVAVFLLAAVLALPVWKQNNWVRLLKKNRSLELSLKDVRSSQAILLKEKNALEKRSRLEKVARACCELDYRELPIVVEGP